MSERKPEILGEAFGHPARTGRCVFCVYEAGDALNGQGASIVVDALPLAAVVVDTANGPRELCEEHARRGTWTGAPTRS